MFHRDIIPPIARCTPGAPICTAVPDGATFLSTGPGGVTIDRIAGSEALTLPITSTPVMAVRGPDGTVWAEASASGGARSTGSLPTGRPP